ncbi:uncharacterized protein BDR25DRAFT_351489 [Lindgomyces ingoldianus]|uniref:Uncharacterized protein n=1 Tax=Lindgomyces ingoldianus TaxID=673940 RepID=A0ACB6R6V4_9PLEO|nr:uncharacterized protein BDR25DRAFT_351489 [Lindgomyces ingoldianus]KAF2475003.1 hypothetical protein BDR25DRAFT_351489 [Lindgomyces ingoldianus]
MAPQMVEKVCLYLFERLVRENAIRMVFESTRALRFRQVSLIALRTSYTDSTHARIFSNIEWQRFKTFSGSRLPRNRSALLWLIYPNWETNRHRTPSNSILHEKIITPHILPWKSRLAIYDRINDRNDFKERDCKDASRTPAKSPSPDPFPDKPHRDTRGGKSSPNGEAKMFKESGCRRTRPLTVRLLWSCSMVSDKIQFHDQHTMHYPNEVKRAKISMTNPQSSSSSYGSEIRPVQHFPLPEVSCHKAIAAKIVFIGSTESSQARGPSRNSTCTLGTPQREVVQLIMEAC